MAAPHLLLSALVLLAPLAGAEPPPALELAIAQALPAQRELRLHLRWDASARRWTGFATAPGFNRARGLLDASGLRWDAAVGAPMGAVEVRLPSDGWVPPPPGEVALALELRLRRDGDGFVGTSACASWPEPRAVAGAAVAAAPPAAARLLLTCEAAIPVRERPQRYRLPLVLGLRDGRVHAVRCPAVSLTDVSYQLHVAGQDLRIADGRLVGTLRLEQRTQAHPQEAVAIACSFDADVLGATVAGRVGVRTEGGDARECWLHGRLGPAEEWGVGRCRLTLLSALAPGGFVDVHLALANGRAVGGFATAPNSGNAVHGVDATRLDWSGGRLRGPLALTINADAWTPGRALAVEVDLAARDGEAAGTWRAADGAQGPAVAGCEVDPVPARIGAFTVQCEDALQGAVPWRTRFEAVCQAVDGRVTGGTLRNGHTRLAGTVTGGDIAVRDGRLRGTLQLEVRDGDGAATGPATVTFDLTLVGRVAGGGFTCTQDGATKRPTGTITLRER